MRGVRPRPVLPDRAARTLAGRRTPPACPGAAWNGAAGRVDRLDDVPPPGDLHAIRRGLHHRPPHDVAEPDEARHRLRGRSAEHARPSARPARPGRPRRGPAGRRAGRPRARSWVTRTTVRRSSTTRRASSSRSWRRSGASSAESGSSSSSTAGSGAIARPRATRCCWPPESSRGRRSASPAEAEPLQHLCRPPAALGRGAAAQPEAHVLGHASGAGRGRTPGRRSRGVAPGATGARPAPRRRRPGR